jgi:uncharacterized repeat protein (TIGR01451 family)
MRRLLIVGGALLALVPTAAAAQVVPNADLAIVSNTANVKHAHVGQQVTFTIVATNNGPDAAELDVHVVLQGFVLVRETCDLGISPDTPFCEYGIVQPGVTLTTIAVAQVVSTGAKTATNMACVSSEEALNDPNTSNDCMTATVKVVGRR